MSKYLCNKNPVFELEHLVTRVWEKPIIEKNERHIHILYHEMELYDILECYSQNGLCIAIQ